MLDAPAVFFIMDLFSQKNHADQTCVNMADIPHSSRAVSVCICLNTTRTLKKLTVTSEIEWRIIFRSEEPEHFLELLGKNRRGSESFTPK
jgi:hypothetical protein